MGHYRIKAQVLPLQMVAQYSIILNRQMRTASDYFSLYNYNTSERLRIGSAGQIGLAGANYGTAGQVLTSQGASAAPQWADAAGVPTKRCLRRQQ